MNRRQQASQLMHHSVVSYFGHSNHVWSSKTPLKVTFNEFTEIVKEIGALSLDQERFSTRGYTAQKNAERENLVKIGYSIVIKLKAMAKFNRNKIAEKAVDYSLSQLERLRDQDLIHHCQLIQNKGQEHLSEAEVFELTQSILAGFQAAIEAFKPLITERDAVGDKKTVVTADLSDLFSEASNKLDLMDDLVEAVITEPAFIAGYKQARKVERTGVVKKGSEE